MLVSGLMYEYPHLSITVFTVFGSAVFFLLFPVFDTLGEILLIRREERALAPRRKLDDYG